MIAPSVCPPPLPAPVHIAINPIGACTCPLTHPIRSAPAAPSARRDEGHHLSSGGARPTGVAELDRLPFSIRVLLENALRHAGRGVVTEEHVRQLGGWHRRARPGARSPSCPPGWCCRTSPACPAWSISPPCATPWRGWGRSRPDQPGGPLRPGHRPLGPGGLLRHRRRRFSSTWSWSSSVTVERYQLLKFAQRAFRNFRVVPPGTGIVHQVNLEYLAPVVQLRDQFGELDRLPRHAGRHRLPHHHDQRPRRGGLGRGRHRGGGGDAGPALLHADPRGRRA